MTNARYMLSNFEAIHKLNYLYSVKEIQPGAVVYTIKDGHGNLKEESMPTNFVLWSTGIAMNPFTKRVSALLPNQVHYKAIEVDAHLRVKGAPLGTVYAIGDASVVCSFLPDTARLRFSPSVNLA